MWDARNLLLSPSPERTVTNNQVAAPNGEPVVMPRVELIVVVAVIGLFLVLVASQATIPH
jgi:hypothetical protein